jgi:Fe-S-cluster-containing dehydrogenase component
VGVDRRKCTGCKACIAACPYGARYVDAAGFVDKCTFCLHRVKKGREPACVETCPTRSLTFGDLADPRSEVAQLVARRRSKVLREERGNEPNVFFLS